MNGWLCILIYLITSEINIMTVKGRICFEGNNPYDVGYCQLHLLHGFYKMILRGEGRLTFSLSFYALQTPVFTS